MRNLRLLAVASAFAALAGCGGSRVHARLDTTTLAKFLQSPDHRERRRAAVFLGQARDPAAMPSLAAALETERYAHVIAAELNAVGYIAAPDGFALLQRFAQHPNPKVARCAQNAALLYEAYKPYCGQPLAVVKGRPVLPTPQPLPSEETAVAQPSEEQVAPPPPAPPPPAPAPHPAMSAAVIAGAAVGAGLAASALPARPVGSTARKSVQSSTLCYNHDCNGVRTGQKCFPDKGAYCRSLCAESNCVSVHACRTECR